MTILRVGATQKYSNNFEKAFGGRKSAGNKAAAKTAVKAAKKKPAAKGKMAKKKK